MDSKILKNSFQNINKPPLNKQIFSKKTLQLFTTYHLLQKNNITKTISLDNSEYKDQESTTRDSDTIDTERKTERTNSIIINRVACTQQGPRSVLNEITNKFIKLHKKQEPQALPNISAKYWAVFDADNCKIIEGKSQFQVRQIASLTKIMTFYTVIKIMENMSLDIDKITFKVTQYASSVNGTHSGLKEGMWIRLRHLFFALMLPSGNDAALVLAENCGLILQLFKYNTPHLASIIYDKQQLYKKLQNSKLPVKSFVKEMNKNSKILLLCLTKFANPHGLMNKENKSTAYDVGKLSCQALKIEIIRNVVKTTNYSCEIQYDEGQNEILEWQNTNKLLSLGWSGLKTGITDAAGPCLCSYKSIYDKWKKINRNYLIVLLNCKSIENRWEDSEILLKWITEN